MALDFEQLKQVEAKTKYLVDGFVKTLVNDEDTIIPSLVVSICILFYDLQEFFTVCGDGMIIDETGMTLTTKGGGGDSSCYGNIIISNEYECIYSWELERTLTNGCTAWIGIGTDKSIVNQHFVSGSCFYAIHSIGYTRSHSGQSIIDYYFDKWGEGETIKVIINAREKSISMDLVYNEGAKRRVFKNIEFDANTKYYFAISNYCYHDKDNCIGLKSFKQTILD